MDYHKCKVAIVGNMNNNHFALLRYLLDQGIDATLLLYNNETDHFLPERDTWHIEKWEPRIKKMDIDMYGKSIFTKSRSSIASQFGSYDIYIGHGFTPGYFAFIKKTLDIFIPFGIYVEGLQFSKGSVVKKLFKQILVRLQKKGLNNCNYAIAFEKETQEVLSNYSCNIKRYPIPMVYVENSCREDDESLNNIIQKFKAYDLVLFSHVSLIWKKNQSWWLDGGKGNDKLIKGFAKYIKKSKRKSLLALVEYGSDILETKDLVKELGIEDHVLWLPIMPRKMIVKLLRHVTFGGGEFWGYLWGGTGWEFMSEGVPFFQYVDMDVDTFEKERGLPFPKIINTQDPTDICNHLLDYEKNPEPYIKMGKELKVWFEKYAGVGLAAKYKDLIVQICKEKSNQ